ncbi:MAG: glycosyltransferase family 2 protein [bacterium]|nr:glycosyltransferase family 2 protein [bacterium]
MFKVAVIIPAHNEEKTVTDVVRKAKSSPLINEVIVVSDGSRDKTAQIARQAGADKVIELPRRRGKGEAMACGVKETDAPFLFFLDADLLGLTPEHLAEILEPVLRGKLVMNVGLRDRGWLGTWLARHLPLIGGERAMRREIFENVPEKYRQNFKVETSLNYYCRANRLPYDKVVLYRIGLVRKMQKFGFWVGIWEYLKMGWEILKNMAEVRMVRQAFITKKDV